MKQPFIHFAFKRALASLFLIILPITAHYCTFKDHRCVDGLAQTAVYFQFDSISPLPLRFYYSFDAGAADLDGSPVIKVAYWLRYHRPTLLDFNKHIHRINWTTEVAFRIGNLSGKVGGANNGCDNVWGESCSANLKDFLKSSIYNLSVSGIPYETPLERVLQSLTSNNTNPYIEGCPSNLFQIDKIPTSPIIRKARRTNHSTEHSFGDLNVAPPGDPSSPWRTWYIPNKNPLQQAQEIAVGIVARGPAHGSTPLQDQDDIQVELICTKTPKEDRRFDSDDDKHHHHHDHHEHHEHNSGDDEGDEAQQEYNARAIINTYAFNEDDDLGYDEVEENYDNEDEAQDDFEVEDRVDCTGSNPSIVL